MWSINIETYGEIINSFHQKQLTLLITNCTRLNDHWMVHYKVYIFIWISNMAIITGQLVNIHNVGLVWGNV
jgi:hypothetical protein